LTPSRLPVVGPWGDVLFLSPRGFGKPQGVPKFECALNLALKYKTEAARSDRREKAAAPFGDPVTCARGGFQAQSVKDLNMAATVANQISLL
jgi:hypothetical protein